MKVLFTGGLGYIGSHTAVEMQNAGFDVVIADNLSNSKIEVADKIEKITGKPVKFYKVDVCDKVAFEKVWEENPDIFAVVHFAAYKIMKESLEKPLKYYENNLISTFVTLELMQKYNCKNIIFSSSAAVYAPSEVMPIDETFPVEASNPYGRTKLFNEHILRDFQAANPEYNVILLRYFNPVGAHESGLIGEDPTDVPTNLVPYMCKVAVGEFEYLNIWGNDYNTKDGTGVRDFIHIVDLAVGHVKAVEKIVKDKNKTGFKVYNIGTGTGYSVLEMVNAFNNVNGNIVKYKFAERRAGDLGEVYASAKLAEKELGFKATHTLEQMCKSSYNYQKKNKK